MALQTNLGEQLPIPHEPGQWLKLRPLGFAALKAAREAAQIQAAGLVATMGPEVFDRIAAMNQSAEAVEAASEIVGEPKPEPTEDERIEQWVAQHDQLTVLQNSIIAWSYPRPVSKATVADLDEATADWAVRVVARWHVGRTEQQRLDA